MLLETIIWIISLGLITYKVEKNKNYLKGLNIILDEHY